MRYYVEVNANLTGGFIISFNRMGKDKMQIVEYVYHVVELSSDDTLWIAYWIRQPHIIP